jgi:hypothetical protein
VVSRAGIPPPNWRIKKRFVRAILPPIIKIKRKLWAAGPKVFLPVKSPPPAIAYGNSHWRAGTAYYYRHVNFGVNIPPSIAKRKNKLGLTMEIAIWLN